MRQVFAAGVNDIVGTIKNPTKYQSATSGGLVNFFVNLLRFFFVIAGVLALLNFMVAGFQYMTAAGDAKKLEQAWARIWLSLVGLIIIVGSFAFASVFGYLIFGDAKFILNPTIYGPGD